jgi:hypothetical protein
MIKEKLTQKEYVQKLMELELMKQMVKANNGSLLMLLDIETKIENLKMNRPV